jgi:hypothetical protein
MGSDPDCEREIFRPGRYVQACVDNFLISFPEWQREVILGRFDDLPGVRFDGRRRKWMIGDPQAAKPPALATATAPQPAPPLAPLAPRVVRTPKTTKKSRLREEAKLKRDRRREEAKLERNRQRMREADELDRRREKKRRSMMLADSARRDEAYRNKVYRSSAEGIAINKRDQRERLARAHPEWAAALSPSASDGQQ